jgi:intraflagellar transport protein 80
MLTLSNDTLAVMEGPSSGTVKFFETAQGKPLGEAYTHGTAAVQVALNQVTQGMYA